MWTNTVPEFDGLYWYYKVGDNSSYPIPNLVLIHRGRVIRFGLRGDKELPIGPDHWWLKVEIPGPPSMMRLMEAEEEAQRQRVELETVWGKF